MGKWRQGYFRPLNPGKYVGDPTNIVYRSGWEFAVCRWLDRDDNIVKWSSEEHIINYVDVVDHRPHRYFPDFQYTTRDGKIYLIEVKPYDQTQPPKKPVDQKNTKKMKRYIEEIKTFGKNLSKWQAAERYCAVKGWEFKILTEKDMKFS